MLAAQLCDDVPVLVVGSSTRTTKLASNLGFEVLRVPASFCGKRYSPRHACKHAGERGTACNSPGLLERPRVIEAKAFHRAARLWKKSVPADVGATWRVRPADGSFMCSMPSTKALGRLSLKQLACLSGQQAEVQRVATCQSLHKHAPRFLRLQSQSYDVPCLTQGLYEHWNS